MEYPKKGSHNKGKKRDDILFFVRRKENHDSSHEYESLCFTEEYKKDEHSNTVNF